MDVIVQKYGGSSLADPSKIMAVASRIARSVSQNIKIVVVVSAMGNTTDDLIEQAYSITQEPDERGPEEEV